MLPQHPPPVQEVEEILRRPPQDQDLPLQGQDHPPPLQCFPPSDDDQDGEDEQDDQDGEDGEDGEGVVDGEDGENGPYGQDDEDNTEVEKDDHDKDGRPQPPSQRRVQQTGRWHPDLPAL